MPSPADEPTEACPGCGAVLVAVHEPSPRPGASASCARLFEVTLNGLREQAVTESGSAAAVAEADAAYDAQHADPADPGRLRAALALLGASPPGGDLAGVPASPRAWRTTVADVAADLDVIDLAVLVEAWARSVREDWAGAPSTPQYGKRLGQATSNKHGAWLPWHRG